MTREPWRYRKYMIVADAANAAASIVSAATLRTVRPAWGMKSLAWALRNIARIRRVRQFLADNRAAEQAWIKQQHEKYAVKP